MPNLQPNKFKQLQNLKSKQEPDKSEETQQIEFEEL